MIRMHKKLWIRMNATVQLTLRIVWVAIGLHFLILFQVIIIWNIRVMAKVIHVHIFSRPRGTIKDYYFSSITAVYSVLTPEDIGAKKSYLLHCGLSGGGSIATKGYHQTSAVYRKQQKEDEATRRYSIYKWNWTYMITPVISRLKTGVYVVSLVV